MTYSSAYAHEGCPYETQSGRGVIRTDLQEDLFEDTMRLENYITICYRIL